MPHLLPRELEPWLCNPFEEHAAAPEVLLARVSAQAVRQASEGPSERFETLLLALGHAQARVFPDQPDAVLDEPLVPKALRARFPRPRGEYLRVLMAAGRCHRALRSLLGTSQAMARVRRAAWAACFGHSVRDALGLERVIRDHDVLLLGETGTGKEQVAVALQVGTPGDLEGRPAPAGAVNAAALPESLVEGELFGHVKGAFTGAVGTRVGRIRSANGGTFFLDEVGDLPSTTQVKLLRVIETNEVQPLGSDHSHRVDVGYVAATHKDLEQLVEDGVFRRDLFQRLAGAVIRLPALRERPEDLVPIGLAFVRGYLRGDDERLRRIERWLSSGEAQGYAWPGNARELQNVLRSLLLGLPVHLGKVPLQPQAVPRAVAEATASEAQVVRWYQERVVARQGGNLSAASRVLGVDRTTLRRRERR